MSTFLHSLFLVILLAFAALIGVYVAEYYGLMWRRLTVTWR